VKGRLLDEVQVRSVLEILLRCECLFEASAIELGTHSEEGLTKHKMGQAEAMTANLTEEHHPEFRADLFRYRQQLENSSLPQYVQTVVTMELLYTIIMHAPTYFCQRHPKELGEFHWVIDAKGTGSIATPWEKWWSTMMLPMLQSKSLRKPAPHLEGGDYTYFQRFDSEMPDYLKRVSPTYSEEKSSSTDLTLLMTENFRFSSDSEFGLEAVDIVSNATRRALGGRLGKEGWELIPQLMIHRREQYLQLIALEDDPEPSRRFPYGPVVREFSRSGRPMLTRVAKAQRAKKPAAIFRGV
jgi:hypothetical protein